MSAFAHSSLGQAAIPAINRTLSRSVTKDV
jgi:hypothetical protein